MKPFSRVLLWILSLGVAGYAITAYALFPAGELVHPDMRASFQASLSVTYAHVFGASVALILGPAQLSSRLRRARPGLHRLAGRLYLTVGVFVGGLSGLIMATRAFGGPVSAAGFGLLAVLWLFTGARALAAIRRRDVALHRKWMIRNFALTFAAVTLRLYLPAAMAAGIPFELAYPAIAWLCWLPNLAVAELVFTRTGIRMRVAG